MATVAELRADVTTNAQAATRDIRDFKKEARGADDAVEDLGDASKKAGKGVDDLGDKSKRTTGQLGRMDGVAKRTTGQLGRMDGVAARAAKTIGRIGIAAAAAGVAATAAFSAKSVQQFADFESQFSAVETLFDDSSFAVGSLQENVAGLSNQLLVLRSDSGETFENLNQGLFDLVSAGVAADDAMRVLTDATVLAKAGITDTSTAVDGITTALNAYGEAADRSEIIASKFFTAQKFGKTTVEELAQGLGKVAPLAATLGVSFDELLASQAAATSTGILQVEAYTGLKAALNNIIKPSKDAADEAERLVIQFDSAALKSKGLTQFLADITSSANFADDSFEKLFGSAEALNFALAITTGGAEVYAKTLSELSDETKSVATLQAQYAKVNDDVEQSQKRLKGTIEAIAVAFGSGLAPAVGDTLDKFNEFLRGEDFAARLQDIATEAENLAFFIKGIGSAISDAQDFISPFVNGLAQISRFTFAGQVFRQSSNFGSSTREAIIDRGRQASLPTRLDQSQSLTAQGTTLRSFEANDLLTAVKRVTGALADSAGTVTGALDKLRKAAEKQADASVDRRGDFGRGLGQDATTIGEFSRQIAPLFSEEAAQQLAESIGISVAEAQRRLDAEESTLRREFIDRQEEIFDNLPPGVERAVKDGLSGLDIVADVGDGAEIFGEVFDDLSSTLEAFRDTTRDMFERIAIGIEGLGKAFGRGIQDLGGILGGSVGGLLGSIGGALGAVGQVAGLVSSAVGFFKNLFNQSDFTAQGVFNPATGNIVGVAQDRGAEDNARARDALISSIIDITSAISDLTGAVVADDPSTAGLEQFLNVAVRRTGISVGFQGPGGEPVGGATFENSEAGAQQAFDEAIRLTISALQGGEASLVAYAKAAVAAGDSAEDVVLGLERLQAAFSLTAEELSPIEQALQQIDEVIDPVVDDLQRLGQSITEIQGIAADLFRGLGAQFIKDVRDLNLRLSNETLADYKNLLDEIAQRQDDAFALFQRGGITQGEFDFVQSTGGLQAARFFETLPQEDKDQLTVFLGLLGEVSGSIAVERARLEEQFTALIDNVEETARAFEEAGRRYERLGEGLESAGDRIRAEFSDLTPRDDAITLAARLRGLQNEAQTGSESALAAIPQVASLLTQAARQAFGGTSQFGEFRDFALSVVDDAQTIAERLAKENFEAAENARTDVELLTEIRQLLGDDRQLVTLQGILDEGRLTNKLIEGQLQAFLALFGQGGGPANPISSSDLQDAAARRLAEIQSNQSAQIAAGGQGAAPAPATTETILSDSQLAQIVADNATAIENVARGLNEQAGSIEVLADEIRRDRNARAA